jgi:hypothetical protein
MQIGDTFLLHDPRIEGGHLWIVISHPQVDPEHVVIVNLTTQTETGDYSCLLGPEDHVWIKHLSLVSYRDSKCVAESNLDGLVQSGALVPQSPASDALLKKLLIGAEITGRLPIGCERVLVRQGLIVV